MSKSKLGHKSYQKVSQNTNTKWDNSEIMIKWDKVKIFHSCSQNIEKCHCATSQNTKNSILLVKMSDI